MGVNYGNNQSVDAPSSTPSHTSGPVDYTRSPIQELVPLSAFHKALRRHIDDLPLGYAEEAMREACIEFAKDSKFLRRWIHLDVQAGVIDYYPKAPAQEDIVDVLTIGVRTKYGSLNEYSVRDRSGRGDHNVCRYDSATLWFRPPGTIFLSSEPDCDRRQGLAVEIAVRPSRDCCDVDAEFYEAHRATVIARALQDLYSEKSRSWYEPNAAKKFEQQYQFALSDMKSTLFQQARGTNPNLHRVRSH